MKRSEIYDLISFILWTPTLAIVMIGPCAIEECKGGDDYMHRQIADSSIWITILVAASLAVIALLFYRKAAKEEKKEAHSVHASDLEALARVMTNNSTPRSPDPPLPPTIQKESALAGWVKVMFVAIICLLILLALGFWANEWFQEDLVRSLSGGR